MKNSGRSSLSIPFKIDLHDDDLCMTRQIAIRQLPTSDLYEMSLISVTTSVLSLLFLMLGLDFPNKHMVQSLQKQFS